MKKSSHCPFLLSRRFVQDFRAVVRIGVIKMIHGRHHRPMNRIITSEFIGHQPSRFTSSAFEQATKKPFGCLLIAATLHQNIHDSVVLIDGTPQLLALPLNRDKNVVAMPGIA